LKIAIVTFEGFNEIDSIVAAHILNRVHKPGWKAEITAPTDTVTSMNGVTITAQRPLEFISEADAVIFGSGRLTRKLIQDDPLMARLKVNPARQLIASQCSGALILSRLGLLDRIPVCTDMKTRPAVEAAGVRVLDLPFYAQGNIASAGGCLSSHYLAVWMIWKALGQTAAIDALSYVLPVGQEEEYTSRAINAVSAYISGDKANEANTA
jgi:transcriptional regulator GlxA family with amidase domain